MTCKRMGKGITALVNVDLCFKSPRICRANEDDSIVNSEEAKEVYRKT